MMTSQTPYTSTELDRFAYQHLKNVRSMCQYRLQMQHLATLKNDLAGEICNQFPHIECDRLKAAIESAHGLIERGIEYQPALTHAIELLQDTPA